jgi:hypothetical protein
MPRTGLPPAEEDDVIPDLDDLRAAAKCPATCRFLQAAILSFAVANPGAAQLLPLTDDFQVNTSTSYDQRHPVVAPQPTGSFVVAWCCTWTETDRVVVGRRFDAGGAALGPELLLSQDEPGPATGLGTDGDGDFVVAWGASGSGPGGGFPSEIYARRFAADGTPRGDQFVVNTDPAGEYTGNRAQIAAQPDGDFVVVWDNYGAWGQRYDGDGVPLGGNFEIPAAPADDAYPAAAARPNGGWVMVWERYLPSGLWLRGQRFRSDGERVGTDFVVAGPTAFWGSADVGSQPDGRFVVTWTGPGTAGGAAVRARRFAANGTPLAPSFVVHAASDPYEVLPDLAVEPDGSFDVVWQARSPDDFEVFLRRFAADGTPLGAVLRVNSFTTGSQGSPGVAVLADEALVVVWDSDGSAGTDSWTTSVQGRVFRIPFFMDGFENGTTSRWSSPAP